MVITALLVEQWTCNAGVVPVLTVGKSVEVIFCNRKQRQTVGGLGYSVTAYEPMPQDLSATGAWVGTSLFVVLCGNRRPD